MSQTADGGPAFPFEYEVGEHLGRASHSGMSLRDWFAGQSIGIAADQASKGLKEYELAALFGDRGGIRPEEVVAALAYKLADAMLAARAKSGSDQS